MDALELTLLSDRLGSACDLAKDVEDELNKTHAQLQAFLRRIDSGEPGIDPTEYILEETGSLTSSSISEPSSLTQSSSLTEEYEGSEECRYFTDYIDTVVGLEACSPPSGELSRDTLEDLFPRDLLAPERETQGPRAREPTAATSQPTNDPANWRVMGLPKTESFGSMQFDTIKDVQVATTSYCREIQSIKESNFEGVNIHETMHELLLISDLLRVADDTSRGYLANVEIKMLMSNYQTLLADCKTDLILYKSGCMKALQKHVEAIESVDEEDVCFAIEIIKNCCEIAAMLARKAGVLAEKAEVLTKDAEKTLNATTGQDVKNLILKQKIEDDQRKFEEERAVYGKRQAELKIAIAEINEEEDEAKHHLSTFQNERAENSENWFDKLLSSLGGFITRRHTTTYDLKNDGNIKNAMEMVKETENRIVRLKEKICDAESELKKNDTQSEAAERYELPELRKKKSEIQTKLRKIKMKLEIENDRLPERKDVLNSLMAQHRSCITAYQDKVMRVQELRHKMQKDEREAKENLAGLAVKLASGVGEISDVKLTVDMLSLTIRALGIIKTSIHKTQRFWLMQEEICRDLTDVSSSTNYLEKVKTNKRFMKRLTKNITQSGVKWLALYNVNDEALRAIKPSVNNMDNVMCNLGGEKTKEDIIADAKRTLKKLNIGLIAGSSQPSHDNDSEYETNQLVNREIEYGSWSVF